MRKCPQPARLAHLDQKFRNHMSLSILQSSSRFHFILQGFDVIRAVWHCVPGETIHGCIHMYVCIINGTVFQTCDFLVASPFQVFAWKLGRCKEFTIVTCSIKRSLEKNEFEWINLEYSWNVDPSLVLLPGWKTEASATPFQPPVWQGTPQRNDGSAF